MTIVPDNLEALKGKRIRLLSMPDDPDPVLPGTEGEIIGTYRESGWYQLSVKWDTNRSLSLICPPDTYEIVS